MTTDYKLSVIIPTYYRYECLENILLLLKKQTVRPYEIVIADQTPIADRPVSFYKKFNDLPLSILNLTKPSLSGSKNLAAKASKGALLLFMDDDMVFSSELLENHIEVLKQERVDVVHGAVSDSATLPNLYERTPERLDPISFFLKSPKKRWNGMTLVTHGGNTCLKKKWFMTVGGYDEKMLRMEDHELGYRLFLQGAKIYYSTKPFAQHKRWDSGGTRKSQKDIPYIRLISKLYLYKKHFPGWTTKQFIVHELISAVLFRDYISGKLRVMNLLQPYLPLVRLWKVFKANSVANKLIIS